MGSGDGDNADTSAPRRRRFWRTHQVAASSITHLDVLYGSRTGTAKDLATDLANRASKRGVKVSLKEMNEFDPAHFDEDEKDSYYSPSRATVFVVSTHYAGPPPNAETFVEWLRAATDSRKGPSMDPISTAEAESTSQMTNVIPGPSTRSNRVSPTSSHTRTRSNFSHSLPTSRSTVPHSSNSGFNWRHLFWNKRKKSFARLQFAVFGVGNSTYLTYNAVGKLIDARLHGLGAKRLCPLGLGDVSNNINATFSKWEAQLLHQLAPHSTELADSAPAMTMTAKKIPPRPLVSAGSAAQLTIPRMFSGSAQSKQYHQQRRQSFLRRSSSAVNRSAGRQSASMREYYEATPVAPLTLTVLDLNGHPIRMRFRCRFLANERSEEARKASFLPVNCFNYAGLSGRQMSGNSPQSWFRLKTLTMVSHMGIEDCKRLALLRLSIEDSDINYEAAGSFGFFPPNAPEVVECVANLLGFDLNAYIEILVQCKDSDLSETLLDQAGEQLPFPRVCTVRTILRNFLELRMISREFVRLASGFATVPKEHELLETLSSTDGAAAFRRHFTQEKGGVLKLLELAPSLHIPFEVLINITPLIKPRFHFIATSPLLSAHEFDITVALGGQGDTDGLVESNWQYLFTQPASHQHLKDTNTFMPATPLLRGFFSDSGFSTPSDRSAPILMIAEGIGIVPFRALLQQRQLETDRYPTLSSRLSSRKASYQSQAKNLVFLGCSDQDSLLFEPELLTLKNKGVLELHIAFHNDASKPHELVQNLVDQHWQQIDTLMASSQESRLYVCGNAAMVREVHDLVTLRCEGSGNEWYQLATLGGRYAQSVIP
ncbi:unnamed protein product [Phytophthora fragariaefolia]|uniref:NADPH--hemoprotein reductase n=1 Tax=Phytophthora fragariaefolia TaxID=1490495 RepID=A0A9W6XKD3_9STRA|nr:unnamed protein product [Phytophthora fragariaefolia]